MSVIIFSAIALAFAVLLPTAAIAVDCADPFHLPDRAAIIEPCTERLNNEHLIKEEHIRVLEYRARGYRAAKRDDDALKDLDAAFALSSDDAALYTVRAGILRDRGDFEGAWHDGLRAIELEPQKVRHYEILINIAVFTHNFETAKALIEHATSLDEGNVALMIWRYFYHWRKGEMLEAIRAIEKALASSRSADRKAFGINYYGRQYDTDITLRLFRGQALMDRHDWEEAARAYEDAVNFARNELTLTERAYYKIHSPGERGGKSFIEALEDADAALQVDPSFDRAHMVRGLALQALKRTSEALAELNLAIDLSPSIDRYYLRRARIHRELGNVNEAVHDFTSYIKLEPRHFETFVQGLSRLGYLLETPGRMEITPAFSLALRACATDMECF